MIKKDFDEEIIDLIKANPGINNRDLQRLLKYLGHNFEPFLFHLTCQILEDKNKIKITEHSDNHGLKSYSYDLK